ncbi:AAA family ATPase [Halomonas sp. QHL1]|uniref:AAA family ATPase n=1 Tax=Halomonas sp. QHL1 TaxID=1123773 RepID=UPI0008FD1D01|nr:AAA family ATPase [Halomonas sp. QHL1]OJA06161.1 AAA family ATPase [Halomonas sp. QHL1]
MQLRTLAIPHFRNLSQLAMTFTTELEPVAGVATNEPAKRIRSHALIGQNGTGKSNLIEALITLFRDVDLDQEAAFDYTLEYEIRGHIVRIEADTAKQKRPYVWVNGKSESQGYLLKNRELLPSHIFAYYSGRNERIEQLFQEHQRRFNQRQEITTDEVFSDSELNAYTNSPRIIDLQDELRKFEGKSVNEMSEEEQTEYQAIQNELKPFEEQRAKFLDRAEEQRQKRRERLGDDRLRRLFYCRGGHSQLVLLACLLSDDPVFQKVLNNLHIESLESALFVLKEPHRLREKRRGGRFDEHELIEGDPRFWYARGNVVSEFLDKLWQVAWAPIEQEASKQIDFRGRTEKQKQLYLYVPNNKKFKELGELVGGPDSFFRYAEGAYIGDLIDEVRITVKKRDEHGGKVSFTQLSEGELQMLTVLGLMRITREDHCLFLLDEPDTHLNPIWKLRYFDDIEGVLSSGKKSLVQGESQILITTHDPMMVGPLRKEQVHIISKSNGDTLIKSPVEDPQGMGVSGLLKSEMFGLPSTLDHHTLNMLQRRNDLLAKRKHEGLSHEEQQELDYLVVRLDDLGFSREYRDPMYQLFIEQMYKVRSKPLDKLFSKDELNEQNAKAEKIIEQLVKAQRMDDLSLLAQELAETLKV